MLAAVFVILLMVIVAVALIIVEKSAMRRLFRPRFREGYGDGASWPFSRRTDEHISFSGYDWRVKTSSELVGPGPNFFSGGSRQVWVDEGGKLHLAILKSGGNWSCSEVICRESLGYGSYIFHLGAGVDTLDRNVVLGLFTWDEQAPEKHYREADIEFSRWGKSWKKNVLFSVQPSGIWGNSKGFRVNLNNGAAVFVLHWRPGELEFRGEAAPAGDEAGKSGIPAIWSYKGANVPEKGVETIRLNLWLFRGKAPANGREAHVVIERFEFIPAR